MNKKNALHAGITILVFLATIVGVSYSFYTAQLNKINNSTAGAEFNTRTLGVNYSDGNSINLSNILPGATIIKTFTVTNTGDNQSTYNINLIDVVNGLTRKSDMTYTLTSTNNGAVIAQTTFPDVNQTIATNIQIGTGVTQSYTLTIQYLNASESQNVDMNKTVSATIQIVDSDHIIPSN